MGINFHGSRGTLYVDRAVIRLTPEKGSDLEPFEMKRVADPHPLHWANFLDCVRTRKKPNSDIETCVRSSVTSILGNLSLRAGDAPGLGRAEADRETGIGASAAPPRIPPALEARGMITRRALLSAAALPALAQTSFRAEVGINIYSLRYLAEKDLPATLALGPGPRLS